MSSRLGEFLEHVHHIYSPNGGFKFSCFWITLMGCDLTNKPKDNKLSLS